MKAHEFDSLDWQALILLGHVAIEQDNVEEAKIWCEQSLSAARTSRQRYLSALACGALDTAAGRVEPAITRLQQAAEAALLINNHRDASVAFGGLARVERASSQYAAAARSCDLAVEHAKQAEDLELESNQRVQRAILLADQHDVDGALIDVREAYEITVGLIGADVARSLAASAYGKALLDKGEYEAARRLLNEAIELSRRNADIQSVAQSQAYLALLEVQQGNLEEAERLLREALATRERGADSEEIARVSINLASILLRKKKWKEAKPLLLRAHAIDKRLRRLPGLVASCSNLAAAYAMSNNVDKAREYAHEAHDHALELGWEDEIRLTKENLAGLGEGRDLVW
jgi:tetratricopeptide (TPR) repeat protein